jgi:hypothetical protein
MKSSLEGIVSSQREVERIFQDWASRAGWGMSAPRAEPKRDGADTDAERLREEVSALRERLRSLEERLGEKRKNPTK